MKSVNRTPQLCNRQVASVAVIENGEIDDCRFLGGRFQDAAMNQEELSDRLWNFATRIGKTVDALPDSRLGRHVAGQLVRCGTAAAPNYDESGAAESRDDFVHKLSIALKELRESRGWLKFIVKSELLPAPTMTGLVDEAEQLCRILGKSVVTAKNRRLA